MNILKSFFTIGLSTIINILLGLLTTPIITRIVDPSEYGELLVFNTYVGIIASFMYFGLNEALWRFFYEYDENGKKSLLKLCFSIPLVTSIIASIISIVLFKFEIIKIDFSFTIFVLLCLNVIFAVWNYISTEMLQNVQDSKYYSIATLSQKAVYSIIAIIFILLFRKNYLLILVIATALSVVVSASIGTYVTRKYWKFKDVSIPKNSVEIIKYSLPSYVYFVIYSIYDTINNLIVEHFCDEYEVGIYGSAFALVGLFAIIQTAFVVIWRPIQTEHFTLNPDDTEFISKGNMFITIIMFFVGINVIMFKDILCLFLGPSYRAGAQVIPFLVFNPIMNTLISTVNSGVEKSKKSIYKIIIIVIATSLLFGLDFILIPKYGARGAAISVAISLIVQYYLTEYISKKQYSVDYNTKKSFIIIASMLFFAYITTFYEVNILTIIVYSFVMILFVLLYKKDIKDLFDFILVSIKK